MMTLLDEVTKLVKRVILDSAGVEIDLGPEEPLLDSGYLDSLTILQLFVEIHSELGVQVQLEDMTEESFASLKSLTELVEQYRG
jgi:acyl carrier protein